jgi:hypothetical protein
MEKTITQSESIRHLINPLPFSKRLNVHKVTRSSKENGLIRCPHLGASPGIRHVFFLFLRSTVLFITTLNEV